MDAARFQQLVELRAYVAGDVRRCEAMLARTPAPEAARRAGLEAQRATAAGFLPLLTTLIAEEAAR